MWSYSYTIAVKDGGFSDVRKLVTTCKSPIAVLTRIPPPFCARGLNDRCLRYIVSFILTRYRRLYGKEARGTAYSVTVFDVYPHKNLLNCNDCSLIRPINAGLHAKVS